MGCRLWGRTESDTTERPHNKHLSFGEAMLMFHQPQGGAVTIKIKAGGMSDFHSSKTLLAQLLIDTQFNT